MFHALLAPSIFFFPDFLCVIDKAIEGNKNGCPTLWLHVVCVMHWGSNQTSELVHFLWISPRKRKKNNTKKFWFSSFCWFNRSCYRDWCCSCLPGFWTAIIRDTIYINNDFPNWDWGNFINHKGYRDTKTWGAGLEHPLILIKKDNKSSINLGWWILG